MNNLEQAKNLIRGARNILILPASDLQGDNLGSAYGLFFVLKKLGKKVNTVVKNIPEKFQFLANPQSSSLRDFVLAIDTSGKEISEMRYEKNEKDLKIHLALNKGEIKAEDVSFLAFDQNPDLLITLGASSLESLGEFFKENGQLFSETPILNIDNQPSNQNFGEVNLIETTSSLAEISTNLIDERLMDGNIATCLLTGIIYASQNFRNPKTRPKAFETSAFLIKQGADYHQITRLLYKQKKISQIKLLGKVLEKLNFDQQKELHFVSLTKKDFQDCQANSKDLGFVMEELKFNFKYLSNLLILWESHASPVLIKGIFFSSKSGLIEKVLENFEGSSKGEGVLFLIKNSDLISAKEKVLQVLC